MNRYRVTFVREERLSKGEVLAYADGDETTRITLSSTHKAKGMERDRVWLLRDTYLRAKKWRRAQEEGPDASSVVSQEEQNLYYVATTRARRELYLVRGVA